MAKATVECVCKHCNNTFEITRTFCSGKEARRFEEYAAGSYDECDECRNKRKASESAGKAAKIIAEYGIPDITGVSDKQINYASSLRNRYIAQYPDRIKRAYSYLKQITAQEDGLKKFADEKFQGNIEAATVDIMTHYKFDIEYIVLTCSDASKIIDTLK